MSENDFIEGNDFRNIVFLELDESFSIIIFQQYPPVSQLWPPNFINTIEIQSHLVDCEIWFYEYDSISEYELLKYFSNWFEKCIISE